MSSDSPGGKRSFSNWLKPKKSRQTLRKRGAASLTSASSTTLASVKTGYRPSYEKEDVPPLPIAPLQAHREKYQGTNSRLDTQLGENRDYTNILHALSLQEQFDPDDVRTVQKDNRPPGEASIASLSPELWFSITDCLDPTTTVCLALSSKTLYRRLGHHPFTKIARPENFGYKLDFLILLDRCLPHHLLCFPCGKYHRRSQEGQEKLQPAQVLNPVFRCPNERNTLRPQPRHRIAHGRNIPFAFVQLATRAQRFSLRYGISAESLGRRWRSEEWAMSSRYYIADGRLLMRVTSQRFVSPALKISAKRLLLYSREDYWPFFSACAHWRDGDLMDVCKCALDHVPVPRNTAGLQGVEGRLKDAIRGRNNDARAIPSQCGRCQPMRRCPFCPTEYLVEIKITEDRRNPHSVDFRHAIVVTRWSDLGDGTSPFTSIEWAACNGETEEYDSFKSLGRRAISGIFESAFTHDTIPGRRIISMNPDNKRGGEKRNDWY
ncbi:hypothetical protein BGW36DRAFT_392178 [Talaromyces proteolyticus]|uniref:Uncharacterized protein n=1 Tax=Talaromyces proteolyticus TaxID=1131652 RepID=A0AAD4PTI4_9EURO|nr:uncharacterized protein BGW36DRAFT_392178 [Talaromyces proteolyticus]KAH8688788.1 hypothetical protein BGW36DRAFT_392178 [Talaromyces proteolyticus]